MKAPLRYLLGSAAMALGLSSLTPSALSQPTPSPGAPGSAPRNAPADQCYQRGQPRPTEPNAHSSRDEREGANPSRQLSQSGGVVCPPAEVDPKMQAAPPAQGRTPVIPPPGTPGSGSNVQPK